VILFLPRQGLAANLANRAESPLVNDPYVLTGYEALAPQDDANAKARGVRLAQKEPGECELGAHKPSSELFYRTGGRILRVLQQ
jgi:hypothetical protein